MGSVRYVLLQAVWLRRQQIEVSKTKAIVQALIEVAHEGNGEVSKKAFDAYLSAVFPYMQTEKDQGQERLRQVMEREVSKGPITFETLSNQRSLRDTAKKMQLSTDFKEKLQKKRSK